MMSENAVFLILGNQLFNPSHFPKEIQENKAIKFFMREDYDLCTHYKIHKQKILFFLTAMREYRDELESHNYKVDYHELANDKKTFIQSLAEYLRAQSIQKIYFFEVEDKFFEIALAKMIQDLKLESVCIASPMFISSRLDFKNYLKQYKKVFMKNFYEQQRKKHKILLDQNLKPLGVKWSFDTENRKSLPTKVIPPNLPVQIESKYHTEILLLIEKYFKDHPGNTDTFVWPCNRKAAQEFFKIFMKERMHSFGDYEDAFAPHSDFVFHSAISPMLNVGLLTPKQIVNYVIKKMHEEDLPLASVEGFVRQIIGWREFIRGVYQNFSEKQDTSNFWQHHYKLSDVWYKANSGVSILDHSIHKTLKYGWAHHIERLMLFGSLMLLLEIEPQDAHKWFMEMFIDSSDWVMGPNVYGMAMFSDGGIFATKPYICSSNYYKKMGAFKNSDSNLDFDWAEAIDGLYWSFIEKHRMFFAQNPRLSMICKNLDKMSKERKDSIYAAADKLRAILRK